MVELDFFQIFLPYSFRLIGPQQTRLDPSLVSQNRVKLFPARESLVSDIPAGDGKIANLFLQCRTSVHLEGIGEVVLFMDCRPVGDSVPTELPVENILVHVQQGVDTAVS